MADIIFGGIILAATGFIIPYIINNKIKMIQTFSYQAFILHQGTCMSLRAC